MTSMIGVVGALLRSAIRVAYPGLSQLSSIVQPSNGIKFGDYKCVAPMSIAKVISIQYYMCSTCRPLSVCADGFGIHYCLSDAMHVLSKVVLIIMGSG